MLGAVNDKFAKLRLVDEAIRKSQCGRGIRERAGAPRVKFCLHPNHDIGVRPSDPCRAEVIATRESPALFESRQ